MIYLISFVLGLVVGSFINAFIWRLKNKKNFINARSICPLCKNKLAFYDLIPIISFIILGGKCRKCAKKISLQYPFVELLCGLLFVIVSILAVMAGSFGVYFYLYILRGWIFVFFLLILFLYDLKYYEVPLGVVAWGALVALVVNIISGISVTSLLLGMLFGYAFFAIQYYGSRGRFVGGGDMYAGLMIGAILGWPNTLLAVFIAYIIGALFSPYLIFVKKKTMKSQVPFCVFLVLGGLIAFFWGQMIINYYFNLL